MTAPHPVHRMCPTRSDSRASLVVHKVTVVQCQDRQRGRYHKCYTCVFNNATIAKRPGPAPARPILAAATPPIVDLPLSASTPAAAPLASEESPKEPAAVAS